MTVIPVPPSGADKERVYTEWAQTAAREYRNHGGLYMHLKGPDEPGHDGDWRGKTEIIETIDRVFFGTLLDRGAARRCRDRRDRGPRDAGHPRPSFRRPGPAARRRRGCVRPDGSRVFNEAACARGSLGP